MKICVLGLGYIGLPTSVTLALAGFQVQGVDINKEVVAQLESGQLHFSEPGLPEAYAAARPNLSFAVSPSPADAFIICVQSPCRPVPGTDDKSADLSYVASAARMVGKVLKPGNLVVLESTVPPETTRMVERVCCEESGLDADSFYTAHCPERVIPGQILKELRCNDRIIGARNPKAAELARDIYARVVTEGQIRLTDDITAECCKLVENTFRDINIAYANELSILASQLGIDVFQLIELANCHPRVNVHTPGAGVGGHCIAVDPWFLQEKQTGGTSLIKTARLVNDGKPTWVAEQVEKALPLGSPVCVMGLAYKPDVDDLRESPGLALCGLLRDKGYQVCACEPHAAEPEIRGFRNLSLQDALDSNCYLVLALNHTVFRPYQAEILARPHFDCIGFGRC